MRQISKFKKGFIPIQSGFTLIELLVVIAVVGVLAGAIVVMVNPALQQARARNAQRKSDLRQIASALDRYVTVNGSYPITGAGVWCSTANTGAFTCGTNPLQVLVDRGELKKLPVDLKANQVNTTFPSAHYCYVNPTAAAYIYRSDDGLNYKILAHCTPEGQSPAETFQANDLFYDPVRPQHAWQVSTPGAINW